MTMHQIPLPGIVEPPTVELDDGAFDWFKDDSIVVEEQPAVAVYRNRRNHLVIRSQGSEFEEDKFIFLATPDALRLLVAALQRELKEWR